LERDGQVTTQVQDRLGNPLVLPDQLWLFVTGNTGTAWELLQAKELNEMSEVHYPDREAEALLLLDEVAGGCFYIYERLVRDAD
jgi:DEAD/DEAH box helicase domain-containing protein